MAKAVAFFRSMLPCSNSLGFTDFRIHRLLGFTDFRFRTLQVSQTFHKELALIT